MQAFTLGVHNLPAAETALIKTLMRLYALNTSFRWRFAEVGPFDVVLVDATCVAGHPPASLARTVLKITRADAVKDADSLARPIRAEQLQAWLARQEPHVQGLKALQQPAALPASEPKRTKVNTGGLRFKLQRWPSAALLKNDPQRIRLATLLSRRALGTSELSHISRLPPEQCLAFVDHLRQAGLIEVQTMAPPPRPTMPITTATPIATRRAAPAPAPAVSLAHGLISGIRRRLGL